VLFFLGGMAFFISRIKILLNSELVIGTIEKKIKLAWRQASGNGYAYHLVIRYTDNKGAQYTFREQNSIVSFFYSVGDKVEILVDSDNPSKGFVKNTIGLFSAPILIITFSIVAAYVGIINL